MLKLSLKLLRNKDKTSTDTTAHTVHAIKQQVKSKENKYLSICFSSLHRKYIHKKNKSASAGEEGEKVTNMHLNSLTHILHCAKSHMHPYKKLTVSHGLPGSQVDILHLWFNQVNSRAILKL